MLNDAVGLGREWSGGLNTADTIELSLVQHRDLRIEVVGVAEGFLLLRLLLLLLCQRPSLLRLLLPFLLLRVGIDGLRTVLSREGTSVQGRRELSKENRLKGLK
jgi:hypothetical protein